MQTARLNESLTDGCVLTKEEKGGRIFLNKKKKETGFLSLTAQKTTKLTTRSVFMSSSHFSMLDAHSCTLACGNTLTHCKMHAHFRAIPAAPPPTLLPLLTPASPPSCFSLPFPLPSPHGWVWQGHGFKDAQAPECRSAIGAELPIRNSCVRLRAARPPCAVAVSLFLKRGHFSCLFLPPPDRLSNGLACVSQSAKQMQTNQVLIVARCNDVYARRQINLFYFGSHNSTPGGFLPSFFSGQPYLRFCLLFSWKLLSCRVCFPCALDKSWCVMWIIQKFPRVYELWWSWKCRLDSTITPQLPGVAFISIYMYTTPRVITCRLANGDSACQGLQRRQWENRMTAYFFHCYADRPVTSGH